MPSQTSGIYACMVRALLFGATFLLAAYPALAQTWSWPVNPQYETKIAAKDTVFNVTDRRGTVSLYDASYAVLIIQGDYTGVDQFPAVKDAASRAQELLVPVLERLGFKVLVWRDLKKDAMGRTLESVFTNIGYRQDTRFFFYYFGHSYSSGPLKNQGTRTFLVPVDAVNPITDYHDFVSSAVPITRIVSGGKEAILGHGFFAIEACQAGRALLDLTPTPLSPVSAPLNEAGWVTSEEARRPALHFLTAGNRIQRVPATNTFTTLLAAALTDQDAVSSQDFYVTGTGVTQYVKRRLKQYAPAYELDPEAGTYPFQAGDMVFGRIGTPETAPKVDNVLAAIGGRVATVNVRPGQAVKTGEQLVSLDAGDPTARMDQYRAELNRTTVETRLLSSKIGQLRANGRAQEADEEQLKFETLLAKKAVHEKNVLYEFRRIEQTRVAAPFSGTVKAVNVKGGEYVRGAEEQNPTVLVTMLRD